MKEEVENMLDDLQLTDKKSTLSSQLSGGMKRKLRLICLFTASRILPWQLNVCMPVAERGMHGKR